MDCSEPITKKEKVLEDNSDINMTDSDCSAKVQSVVSEDHILNFPIPIDGGKACIAKVCDERMRKNILDDIIDSLLNFTLIFFLH